MSTDRKRKRKVEEVIADAPDVAAWLKSNPDFFETHPGLLAHLKLPHQVGANAVSLIERQVAILREKNRKLDQKLRELVAVARANDILANKIHVLALRLVGSNDSTETLSLIEQTLREDLGSDHSVLFVFEQDNGAVDAGDLLHTGFVRHLSGNEDGLDLFQSFIKTSRPRCGQIRGNKREFLFGRDGSDIKSAALIPLGDNAATGFLAIGSRDGARFHPGMSTDFLVRLGGLIEQAVSKAT